MAKKTSPDSITTSISAMVAGGLALNVFWVLNLFKEAFKPVKTTLDFYPPVGPLLGVFLASITAGLVLGWLVYLILKSAKPSQSSEKVALRFYVLSAVLFFFMVFPPVFVPIAEWLAGK